MVGRVFNKTKMPLCGFIRSLDRQCTHLEGNIRVSIIGLEVRTFKKVMPLLKNDEYKS